MRAADSCFFLVKSFIISCDLIIPAAPAPPGPFGLFGIRPERPPLRSAECGVRAADSCFSLVKSFIISCDILVFSCLAIYFPMGHSFFFLVK